MSTPDEIQHQAFLQVVGEMWHELQKFKGNDRRVSLHLRDLNGSAVICAQVSWFDETDKMHSYQGWIFPFSNIPGCMDTTMIFRDLSERQRKEYG